MSVGKNRSLIHSVIVQEGIRTSMLVENLSSEPVIYLFGSDLIGGFIRSNTVRGNDENLNASGMVFKKLCMSDLRTAWKEADDSEPISELVYGVVARLAVAASAKEIFERNTQ
jgi:glutamate--cysteine ligase